MTAAARCRLVLLASLCLILAAFPALAKKSKEGEAPVKTEPSVFELESKALASHPEVLEALRAARAAPTDPEAFDHLGQVLSGKGGYQDAVEVFQWAADLAPGNETYLNNLGVALLKLGEPSEALKAFEQALEIESLSPLTHYNLGVAHQALGHYEEGLQAFETAFLLEPDLADPKKNPAVVNNPGMMAIRLRVYLRTSGSTPAIYQSTDKK